MHNEEQIRRRWGSGIGLPALTIGTALAVNLVFHRVFGTYTLLFVFMIAISITATLGGPVAGLAAAALSVLSALFFLVEPLHTLSIAVPEDRYRLGVFALCGLLSVLGAWFAQRARPPLPEG